MKLLPLYAASLCSEEWLDTVESYQDDPETLRIVLDDFCSTYVVTAALVIAAQKKNLDTHILVFYGCPIPGNGCDY